MLDRLPTCGRPRAALRPGRPAVAACPAPRRFRSARATVQVLVLSSLALFLAAAPIGCKGGPSEIKGQGFTIPVPDGFTAEGPLVKAAAAPGLVAIARTEKLSLPDAFGGSIVVAPIPDTSFDPADAVFCEKAMTELAARIGGPLKEQGIGTFHFGKSCRGHVQDGTNRNREAIFIMAHSAKGRWMITCNYDARDEVAKAGCDAVSKGIRFE